MHSIIDTIHARAQLAVRKYKACEVELIEVFELAEKNRVHMALGHSSLFAYATLGLGLSEEVAYTFINVARKVREVPALKERIREGAVSISKAKRISSVLTKENQEHWLGLAARVSKRELEKLVAAENPKAAVVEKASYVSRDRMQLQVGLSEGLMLELRRAQDVLSQKRRRPVGLEEVLTAAVGEFLERHDPLARAKRQEVKGKLSQLGPGPVGMKRSVPAAIRHEVLLRASGQCAYKNSAGIRCNERRFLQIHHRIPVHQGGSNMLNNLELLCSSHHNQRHGKS